MLFLLKLVDYNIIFINLILITVIAMILIIINFFIRQKNNKWEINIQKYSAYECGFEPFSETQAQVFEIQFFLVSIMFLIFDVELALMFPWAVHLAFINQTGFWIMISFIILLTVGFYYEWEKGALNWNFIKEIKKQLNFSFFFLIHELGDWSFLNNYVINNINYLFTIEQLVAVYILILLVIGVILKYFISNNMISKWINQLVAFFLLFLCIYLILKLVFADSLNIHLIFYNYFIIDFYTEFSKMFMIISLLILFFFWTKDYIYYHKYIIWELPILLLLACWFMMLLLSSFNLFSLFISLEGLSLCLYILTAYDFDRRSSAEAALKYFTLGTLSSGFLLLGIVLIYIAVGSLDYLTIYQLTTEHLPQPIIRIGSCLIFFSFIFKLGAWPCHQWLPDVYQGAPTIITAFFATSVKICIFFTVLRLFNYIVIEKPLLVIICIMSLIIGILGALKTDKIKRFIAYAAINQMGFLLLGIFVYAINVVLIYFIFYILTTLMIFMVILKTIPLSKATVFELTFTADLKILSFYNKTIRLYLLIILFSMAGLPPFITSFSKWYILLIIAGQNYILILWVTIILTIFSIYYYVKLVKNIFFEEVDLQKHKKIQTFYFKIGLKENIFLILSTSILFFGPIFLYIYFTNVLSFFTYLECFCSLDIIYFYII